MPSETTTATPNWTALKGLVLEGGYEIAECLQTNPASASFRIRVLGDRMTRAVVNVFAPEAAPLEQYALWQAALDMRHPNISSPMSLGRLEWDGTLYTYVILYKADESLAGVVLERALTPLETREVVRSVGAALEHLHANGFVHSALCPENVLALGDSIRLSSTSLRRINTPLFADGETDAIYKAPGSGAENLTVAADIWCLGATLLEVLTRRKCDDDCRRQAASLPEPFDWIVERCLEPDPHERPTLSEVFAILSGGLKRSNPKVMEIPAPAAAAMAASAGASYGMTPLASSAPAIALTPANNHHPRAFEGGSPGEGVDSRPLPPQARLLESPRPKLTTAPKPVYRDNRPRLTPFADEKPSESPRAKFMTYALLAILLAGGLLWLVRPKAERGHPTASAAVNTAAARTQIATPAPSAAVGVAAGTPARSGTAGSTAPGAGSNSATHTGAKGFAAHPTVSPGPKDWRVVVLTFAQKEDAEKRAKALNTKHPGFDAKVFSTDAKGPFLIVLGGPLTRDDANRLRQKARASGFPRDAYVQNF